MKDIIACLSFDGNCRQAMNFYKSCFGSADLRLVTYGEMPQAVPGKLADSDKDKIIHASLTKGSASLIASDSMPGMPSQKGSNFSVCVVPESIEEIEHLWAAFSPQATAVQYKLGDAPWGARYGMLTDQFGIQWMFNYEKSATQKR